MSERFFDLSNAPTSGGSLFTQFISTPRVQFIVLLVLALSLCTIKLDDGGLMAYDECYYAQKAKEMVRSGDWLTQRYLGNPCHMNPWLHMWSIAASYSVFGINEWAARFPTAIQAVLIVLLTFLLVRWLTDRPWIAMLAASCLLFSDFFFKYAKKAHMDHLVTLLFLIAIAAFIAGRRRDQRWFLVMGIAVGLCVLTKSFLGLMPLVVVFAFIVVTGEWIILKRPFFWISIVLAVSLGSIWYLYEYLRFGSEFVAQHFGWQLLSRTFVRNVNGPAFSPGPFLAARVENIYSFIKDAHIWFVLGALGAVFSFFPRGGGAGGSVGPRERKLLVLWVAVPMVLMSFSRTFKGWYLMPAYVPLAIFTAHFLARIIRKPEKVRFACYTVLSLLVLYLAVLVVTPLFTLDLKYEIRHPGIRKLATKVRMLDEADVGRVMYFPATAEIADRNGLGTNLSGYWGIALPWNFYSDRPLDERRIRLGLEEVRRNLSDGNALCLTTEEGYRVISADGNLPFEVIGRAVDRSMTYVVCCGGASYERRRAVAETDYSRSPLYSRRNY